MKSDSLLLFCYFQSSESKATDDYITFNYDFHTEGNEARTCVTFNLGFLSRRLSSFVVRGNTFPKVAIANLDHLLNIFTF